MSCRKKEEDVPSVCFYTQELEDTDRGRSMSMSKLGSPIFHASISADTSSHQWISHFQRGQEKGSFSLPCGSHRYQIAVNNTSVH